MDEQPNYTELMKQYKELQEQLQKQNNICPHCGYCPTCGRKLNDYNYPYYPWYPPYPINPIWYNGTNLC